MKEHLPDTRHRCSRPLRPLCTWCRPAPPSGSGRSSGGGAPCRPAHTGRRLPHKPLRYTAVSTKNNKANKQIKTKNYPKQHVHTIRRANSRAARLGPTHRSYFPLTVDAYRGLNNKFHVPRQWSLLSYGLDICGLPLLFLLSATLRLFFSLITDDDLEINCNNSCFLVFL